LLKDDVAEKKEDLPERPAVRRRIADGGEVGLGFDVGISGYSDQAGYELGRPGCARYKWRGRRRRRSSSGRRRRRR
jgi:hypothetical protein